MLNITHPYKESKLSTNYSFDPPHFFVKKNYDLSAVRQNALVNIPKL